MNITIITPPPFEPVSVAEAYAHLRWDQEEEGSPPMPFYPLEDLVQRNIRTAREFAEKNTRRALVEQTIRLSGAGFPGYAEWGSGRAWDEASYCGYVELLRPPLLEVLSFEYFDETNVLRTIPAENYFVTDDLVPRLRFAEGFTAPCSYRRDDAVRVVYRVGYAPEGSPPTTQEEYAANVPAGFKDAILLDMQLRVDRFDKGEREDLERARDSLLASFTIPKF